MYNNTKELMQCHCGTNNRAPQRTFTDPYKPEVRPGTREESASPAWLAAPAMNARDTTKLLIWRLGTECGPTLYRKCHSHNTPGKGTIKRQKTNINCFFSFVHVGVNCLNVSYVIEVDMKYMCTILISLNYVVIYLIVCEIELWNIL